MAEPVRDALSLVRIFLAGTMEAMAEEGIPEGTRDRVANWLLWGDPDGPVTVSVDAEERVDMLDLPATLPDLPEILASLGLPPV